MEKVHVVSKELLKPIAPYSHGVKAGNFIFVSGCVALDRDGKVVGDDIRTQSRKTFENIKAVLAEFGARMEDIIKIEVFLKDKNDYAGMNEIRAEYFPKNPPGSIALEISDFMVPGLLVEIQAIALAH